MGQSASKIAEAKSEAQVKPRQASLQSKTTVDASPLGQPGGAITSRPKDAIDAAGIDDLNLEALHRKLPSSSVLSPIAPPTSSPPMAPGVGGFNIDPPVPRVNPVQLKWPSHKCDAKHCQIQTLSERHRSKRNGWL
jgi:hypothetical protein